MSKPLRIRLTPGADLSAVLCEELWRLRLQFLQLNKTEEEDLAYFSGFVGSEESLVVSFHDEQGRVQGFFTIAFLVVTREKRKGLLMYAKYFFFNREYRGHYKTLLAPWKILPYAFRRYGLMRLYFVTSAFPQSYVSLSRSTGNVLCLADEEINAWQAYALKQFAEHFFPNDWDAADGVVKNQNTADSESMARGAEAEALQRKYEGMNPNWKNGWSLPIIFAVDPSGVATSLRRSVRRALRR